MSWMSAAPDEVSWQQKPRQLYGFLRELFRRDVFDALAWDPPNIPAGTTVTTTLTNSTYPVLDNMRAGMAVYVTPPSALNEGLAWGAWCASDGQISIRLANVTGSDINPSLGTWAFCGRIVT